MISYAGVGLTAPTDDLDAILRAWWHPGRILYADHPGHLTLGLAHLPRPYPPRRDPPQLGTLNWPCQHASRWGSLWHLVSQEQLDRIRTQLGSGTNGPATLVLTDGRGTEVGGPMYMLPPRPVAQRTSGTTPTGEMYLLELVDERYYWWAAGDKPAPSPTPGTWTAFLTALFGLVGVSPTFSGTIPANYDPPDPERWKVGFDPIPVQIDAACRTVGCRVVRTLAGAVSVVRWTEAKAALDANVTAFEADRMTGGRVSNLDIGRSVPASVCVVFGNDPTATATNTLASLASGGFVVGYGTSTAGVGGRTGLVKADLSKDATGSARNNWALEAASDYYRWQLPDWEADYRGAVKWTPTGAEGHVEWRHVYTGPDSPLIVTHVRRPPPFDPNVYGGESTAGGGAIDVCGTPVQRTLTQTTDANCIPCDIQDKDIETYLSVNGIYLNKCVFKVLASDKCGGHGAAAANSGASSSSGPIDVDAVEIHMQGKTGVSPKPYNIIFCPDTCSILIQWAYDCYEEGVWMGFFVGPAVSCGSGSGSGGSGA